MQQTNSGRFTLVPAAVSFLIGGGLVWLLAKPPAGVASILASDQAPAWVQAVMSVVAIVAAAFVPRWLDAQKRKDASDQYLIFCRYLLEEAESLKEKASTESGRNELRMCSHRAEWQSIADGARELHLNELPHAKYLGVWLQVREMAVRIADYSAGIARTGEEDAPNDHDTLDDYLYRLRNLHNELIDIDVSIRGQCGYAKVETPD
ncbi:hypothetical protein [Xanthomonas translucens]|uniref:hypothetical protein n=1 Tax=Xanthomonas campestris pv. translucens TaxID=343 RepID=UPI00071E753C|nr:hypothetical protein [Xanthomonas translucens]WLA02785.1 hypothetical protein MO330_09870 [Xanthomonas translucens]